MTIRSHSKSSLFLMEMIVAILFLCIGAAICVRLFAAAHLLAQESEKRSRAQNLAASAAETISGCDGDLSALLLCYPTGELDGGCMSVSYDADWESCDTADAVYVMRAVLTTTDTAVSGTVAIETADGETIYSLPLYFHLPKRL